MTEKNYDFRKRMLEVHKKDRRTAKPLGEGQIEIDGSWSISFPEESPFLGGRAEDLRDYFSVSMGIDLKLSQGVSDKVIIYETDSALSKDGEYKVDVSKDRIRLIGKDERAAAQAGYLLEDILSFEQAPYLNEGVTSRAPAFRCRMVHSGIAEDDYPDEHLNAIAHSGINTILLYVCGINKTDLHELDFNDLIARAAKYGIDVYAYSHMESKLHPDDEGAEEFYDRLYGELFRQCPGIKGVIFVGESTEFPSKDPRTSGMSWLKNRGPDGKRLINKPSPGWYTCSDYPQWMNLVKDTIRKVKPDADLVFWTYNLGGCPEKDRIELINNLPSDITLECSRLEKGLSGIRQDVFVDVADYTSSFPEEGSVFTSEAIAASKKGMPVYTMTNAGGLTWDIGVVPYIPAPYLWAKRYEAMKRCSKEYGLCGSMDSHHYGFCPSIISELAKEYLDTEAPDGEKIIERLIVRDWGEENKEAVERAYRIFSDAVYDHITSNIEQYGPLRIGPAYPLVLFADEDIKLWSYPGARHHGNMICFPNYRKNAPLGKADYGRFDKEIAAFKSCAERMISASDELFEIVKTLPENKRDDARRIAGVAQFVGRTYLTTYHVKRWYREKLSIKENDGDIAEHIDELKRIGTLEIENVKAAIPLVEFDSRLGYEPSMDYVADRAHLEWKLEQVKRVLEEELPSIK